MIYHVYHPTKHGKKRWGYYYTILGEKKVTCVNHPRTGLPFASKAEVNAYLVELRASETTGSTVTVGDLGEYLFLPDGDWARRRARKRDSQPLAEGTLYQHAMIVRRHIIPYIGHERVSAVDWPMVETWIYDLHVSNSTRRNIVTTLRLILKEAIRRRIIKAMPLLDLPGKGGKKPSTLTLRELALLFPEDPTRLRAIWKERYDIGDEGLAFAACSACMFFGGMRPQEARAVRPDQLIPDIWAILVIRSMNGAGHVQEYVKMANARDPRYRGTFLFLQGPTIMQAWLAVRPGEDFLFSFHGASILKDRLQDRLLGAIKRAKIPMDGRWFIPRSGRYTFETVVKPALPRDLLMILMGHTDPAMPEHYDVPVLTDRMRGLAAVREEANRHLLPARAVAALEPARAVVEGLLE